VATSTILDLSLKDNAISDFHIITSSEVHENLINLNLDFNLFFKYEVSNFYGFISIFKKKPFIKNPHNKLFVFFGPLYTFRINCFCIMGFAQPWIIYPKNEIYNRSILHKKLFYKLKYKIQKYFYNLSNILFVEHLHVRDELFKINIFKNKDIKIIQNSISNIFLKKSNWLDISDDRLNSTKFKIGFLGRNYPHKNTSILPSIKKILQNKYELDVLFFVTFDNDEWNNCNQDFKNEILNLGVLTLAQCPTFYNKINAVIFPSLLECFSATPIEALFMGKPLFASNRSYITNICLNYAYYFNPIDPDDIAKVISNYIIKNINSDNNKLHAKEYVLENFNSTNRTNQYLDLLKD
jgi:glycosyltransferase involved in cell wall biosynthesis